eukprot:TRINITY_DN39085_c0_g1_i1.p1 TRINITY_DN39085_c0_g1~~TRINITY_DN39085_c0_g1_i1.p1  ORF type:complete len:652 (-),score=143.71 TRINITY_DN39085_c0_g1_i1:136-2091(-)
MVAGSPQPRGGQTPRKGTIKESLRKAALASGQKSLGAFFRQVQVATPGAAGAEDAEAGRPTPSTSSTSPAQLHDAEGSEAAERPSPKGRESLSLPRALKRAIASSPTPMSAAPLETIISGATPLQATMSDDSLGQSDSPLQGDEDKAPGSPCLTRSSGAARSSLRERLARRVSSSALVTDNGGVASSPEKLQERSLSLPEEEVKLGEHKALGGISLKWRLLLEQGSRAEVLEKRRRLCEEKTDTELERPTGSTPGSSPTRTTNSLQSTTSTECMGGRQSPPPQLPPRQSTLTSDAANEDGSDMEEADLDRQGPGKAALQPEVAAAGAEATDSESPEQDHENMEAEEDLQALLVGLGLLPASSSCTQEEMRTLLEKFNQVRMRPLRTLRALCYKMPSAAIADADTCAKFLLRPATNKEVASEAPASASGNLEASLAARMLALDPRGFSSRTAWAFSLLSLESMEEPSDAGEVQRTYRLFMRQLHPDRVGSCKAAAKALELLREAKVLCEQALSTIRPPPRPPRISAHLRPHGARGAASVASAGRCIDVTWDAPGQLQDAPIRRYIVAALDRGYGRSINLAVLEPDYCDKVGRFVPIEELRSYCISEAALGRLAAGLFQQRQLLLQVAAANEAGQSAWATAVVRLSPQVDAAS